MRTLLAVLLLGLVLSIRLSPAHLEEGKDNVSQEEKDHWKEFEENCLLESLSHGPSQDANICEGMDEETCKLFKEDMEEEMFMQGNHYCTQVTHAGRDAFHKCADEKCDGHRTEKCGEEKCQGDVRKAIEEKAAELQDTFPKKLEDVDSIPIEPMGDDEKEFWEEKVHNCTQQLSHGLERAGNDEKCAQNPIACAFKRAIIAAFVDTASEDICKNITREAVTIYEHCAKRKCDAKRSEECRTHKCKHDIVFFYSVARKATIEGLKAAFAEEPSDEHENVEPLELTGNAEADAMNQLPDPLAELVNPSSIHEPLAEEPSSSEGSALDLGLGLVAGLVNAKGAAAGSGSPLAGALPV